MSTPPAGRNLPMTGLLYYNGYVFPNPITLSLEQEDVYDESERVVKYVHHKLTVEFVLVPYDTPNFYSEDATDTNMNYVRNLLEQPQGILLLVNKGYGNVMVNMINPVDFGGELFTLTAPNGTSYNSTYFWNLYSDYNSMDMNLGPKPRVLKWEPIGSNKACRVVWTCDFWISQCRPFNEVLTPPPTEFSYALRWNINDEGIITRTTSGRLEIPIHPWTAVNVGPSANDYRALVFLYLPWLQFMDGYHRDESFEVSRDRKYLDFTITDAESPSDNPYFPFTMKIEAEHDTQSSLLPRKGKLVTGGFQVWDTVLRIEIVLAPGAPRWFAWLAMTRIFQDRVLELRSHLRISQIPDGTQNIRDSAFIVTKFRMTESLYSRKISFQIDYIGFVKFSQIIFANRFFEKLEYSDDPDAVGPNLQDPTQGPTTWTRWSAPLLVSGWTYDVADPTGSGSRVLGSIYRIYGADTSLAPRRQDFSAFDFPISYNNCRNPAGFTSTTPTINNDYAPVFGNVPSSWPGAIAVTQPEVSFDNLFSLDQPEPDASWLLFENEFIVQEETGTITHQRVVQKADTTVQSTVVPPSQVKPAENTGWIIENYTTTPSTDDEAVTQIRGAPKFTLIMRGWALRLGHTIPMPKINTFGGQLCNRLPGARWMHKEFTPGAVNPTYFAAWEIMYSLPNAPVGEDYARVNRLTTGDVGHYV